MIEESIEELINPSSPLTEYC